MRNQLSTAWSQLWSLDGTAEEPGPAPRGGLVGSRLHQTCPVAKAGWVMLPILQVGTLRTPVMLCD